MGRTSRPPCPTIGADETSGDNKSNLPRTAGPKAHGVLAVLKHWASLHCSIPIMEPKIVGAQSQAGFCLTPPWCGQNMVFVRPFCQRWKGDRYGRYCSTLNGNLDGGCNKQS